MTDRAVSEVVSFVLVFSLVTMTVGIVYVGGLGSLESAQYAERVDNAERAFDVLDDNVDDVVDDAAPSRATELKLGGAALYLGAPVQLNVTAYESGTTTVAAGPHPVTLRPVVYEADRTSLHYEAGAVIRQERHGSVVNAEPPFVFGPERTVVPYVQTRVASGQATSVGGEQTVLVRTDRVERTLLSGNTEGPYDIEFSVTSDRAAVWKRYLEAELDASGAAPAGGSEFCQVDGDTVTCEFETERLYVSVTRINVALM